MTSTFAFGLTARTPALKPASKRLITVMSMPPTKPILLVLVMRPATTPTRKEPSCSANVMDFTFGASTTLSMMANLAFGFWVATVFIASPIIKPMPQVML
ncbi:hypothetical protein D3C73_1474910 [compost metagenome]